jgi:hypothetical protein
MFTPHHLFRRRRRRRRRSISIWSGRCRIHTSGIMPPKIHLLHHRPSSIQLYSWAELSWARKRATMIRSRSVLALNSRATQISRPHSRSIGSNPIRSDPIDRSCPCQDLTNLCDLSLSLSLSLAYQMIQKNWLIKMTLALRIESICTQGGVLVFMLRVGKRRGEGVLI